MIKRTATAGGKGWYTGPWSGPVPCRLGVLGRWGGRAAFHDSMFEAYFVARGTSTALVDGETVALSAGDLLVVEPGEKHTFVANSDDYLHFVVQAPFVDGDKRLT